MHRFVAAAFGLIIVTCAFASSPGQPLDCSDWVILDPGISCRRLQPCGVEPTTGNVDFPCAGLSGNNVDALGRIVDFEFQETVACLSTKPGDLELRTYDGVSQHVVAYLRARCVSDACADGVGGGAGRAVDPVNGRVFATIRLRSFNCPAPEYNETSLFVFEGFTTTADVLQSFVPPDALGFRVPRVPEGLPAVDRFDTYHGDLATLGDFSQAQSLQCNYPSSPPAAGDYLTVADKLPNPEAGTGRYYVTAATYQEQTRYGRQGSRGILTGRDPAQLPACISPTENGPIPISAPTAITHPGSYVLTRDISTSDAPAITMDAVTAFNITLDLNGFRLVRTGTTYGGAIEGSGYFVEIHGGEIVGGGIRLGGSFNTIRDVTVRDAQQGVFLEGGQNIVERTRHFSSFIWLDDAHGSIARDNVLQSGFIVIESGSAFQVTHNAVNNGYIFLDGDLDGVLLDNVVTGSSTHGIWGLAQGSRFGGNVVSDSAGFGLYFDVNSSGNTYSGNVCRGNGGLGCSSPAGNADFCDEGTGNESGEDNFMPVRM